MTVLADKVARLENQVADLTPTAPDKPPEAPDQPAPWVWFDPPAAGRPAPAAQGDTPRPDPRGTVENFVDWYNQVFLGRDGGRAKPIPPCWRAHPGLAMEVAALTYGWRAANLGKSATVQQSLYWLHYWRPGFADRLGHDWLHPSCLDGEHLPVGASPRLDRFTGAATDASPQ